VEKMEYETKRNRKTAGGVAGLMALLIGSGDPAYVTEKNLEELASPALKQQIVSTYQQQFGEKPYQALCCFECICCKSCNDYC